MRRKVLLVDDSRFHATVTARAVSKAGYEVSIAADGEQAIALSTQLRPDVVLLDMMLPKIAGPEVLKTLKNNSETTKIPVIVLSSLSQANESRLKHEGAAAYLEKNSLHSDPDCLKLIDIIRTVLEQLGAQSSALPTQRFAATKGRVLIADDSRFQVQMLSSHLVREGFCTLTASDALQAWTTALRALPDAILLDINMPGGSGLEVLRKLGLSATTQQIPVIVVSADDTEREAARKLGATEFVHKPVDMNLLSKMLFRVLSPLRHELAPATM